MPAFARPAKRGADLLHNSIQVHEAPRLGAKPDEAEEPAHDLAHREIVRKLLGFVRLRPWSLVHLNRVVEEVGSLFAGRCAKAGIEMVEKSTMDLPEILADPTA